MVTVVAYLTFVPSALYAYARSLVAAIFSVSNLLFWREGGYFDAPSASKPLLHTWSLGVEEQFYIFFPLFIVAIRRWKESCFRASIWTAACVSFVLACLWMRVDSSAAFYLSPLRGWELLIGTILSQHYLPAIEGKVNRNIASLAGLALILVAAFSFNSKTLFPGLAALAPCVGAALIIAAGETGSSIVQKLLSLPPMVFVGLISYSLYLWHWPILVIRSVPGLNLHTNHVRAELLIASFVYATLSWRFVELPFRNGWLRLSRRPLFLATGVAFAVIAAAGVSLIAMRGVPIGYPAAALQVPQYTGADWSKAWRTGVCFLTIDNKFSEFSPSICLTGTAGRKQYLLLGDSHAAHLYPGLANVFPELDILQANAAFCPPPDQRTQYLSALYAQLSQNVVVRIWRLLATSPGRFGNSLRTLGRVYVSGACAHRRVDPTAWNEGDRNWPEHGVRHLADFRVYLCHSRQQATES